MSRAGLGKMIIFSTRWHRKRARFRYLTWPSGLYACFIARNSSPMSTCDCSGNTSIYIHPQEEAIVRIILLPHSRVSLDGWMAVWRIIGPDKIFSFADPVWIETTRPKTGRRTSRPKNALQVFFPLSLSLSRSFFACIWLSWFFGFFVLGLGGAYRSDRI